MIPRRSPGPKSSGAPVPGDDTWVPGPSFSASGAGSIPASSGCRAASLSGRLFGPAASRAEGPEPVCGWMALHLQLSPGISQQPNKDSFSLSSYSLTLDLPVGLRGTKLGCGEGGCGACTVMLSKYDRLQDKIMYPLLAGWLPLGTRMQGLAFE